MLHLCVYIDICVCVSVYVCLRMCYTTVYGHCFKHTCHPLFWKFVIFQNYKFFYKEFKCGRLVSRKSLFLNIHIILTMSLDKKMATYSNLLAWEIPWKEEPGKLQSMKLSSVRHDQVYTCMHTHTCTHTPTHVCYTHITAVYMQIYTYIHMCMCNMHEY